MGPCGCFWNVEQGFGGYVLQLVRVNLCPNASVTIGTGSQQSMAIGYSWSRRLSIAIDAMDIKSCFVIFKCHFNIIYIYTLKFTTIYKNIQYLLGYDQPLSSPLNRYFFIPRLLVSSPELRRWRCWSPNLSTHPIGPPWALQNSSGGFQNGVSR